MKPPRHAARRVPRSADSTRLTVAGAASSDSCARIASTIGGVICHQATRRGSSAPSIRASRTSAAACARRLPGASPATYASAGDELAGGVAATSRTPVRRAVVRAFWAAVFPFLGMSRFREPVIENNDSHRLHPWRFKHANALVRAAGKKRLLGDTTREATAPEVQGLRAENTRLKQVLAETVLENRLLKKV